jgi:hypothetical protein
MSPRRHPTKLRLIEGLGQPRVERIDSRDAVARLLVKAGSDVLLRRLSPVRAEAIGGAVDEILRLFDRVENEPLFAKVLEGKLSALEQLVRETPTRKKAPR